MGDVRNLTFGENVHYDQSPKGLVDNPPGRALIPGSRAVLYFSVNLDQPHTLDLESRYTNASQQASWVASLHARLCTEDGRALSAGRTLPERWVV